MDYTFVGRREPTCRAKDIMSTVLLTYYRVLAHSADAVTVDSGESDDFAKLHNLIAHIMYYQIMTIFFPFVPSLAIKRRYVQHGQLEEGAFE